MTVGRKGGRPTGHIKSQQVAAQSLGCTARGLRQWESEPWWKPSFRTERGYDVVAILRARTQLGMPNTDLGDTRTKLDLAKRKVEFDLKQAELREALREEQESLGNILPLDIYEEFGRELLGLIRQSLEQLALQMKREAAPEQLGLVWSEAGDSPLQRRIAKIVGDVEAWLTEGPEGAGD